MSLMTVGVNPFRDKEGGDPLFGGLVVWFEEIDQDFMRPSERTEACRQQWQLDERADFR